MEDEIHFLCHCVAYENLRSNLFKSVVQNISQFHSLSDNEKFVIIVNTYEKQLVDFIYQAWRIRQDLLNKHTYSFYVGVCHIFCSRCTSSLI